MAEAPAWGRYAELHPDQIEAIVRQAPVAYLPWGALEWHGPHMPLGTEGFIAEAVAERTAQRTGGVVLPTTWLPITALPHRFSLSIASDVMQRVWDGMFRELARAGFAVVVVLSGHTAPGHLLELMDAAEHAIEEYGLRVLAVPPLALVDEQMDDHAAHWETSLLLALRPRLVALERLDEYDAIPRELGVIGEDPRLATARQGESVLLLASERVSHSVRALLTVAGTAILRELYVRRRAMLQPYVERYFAGSWEQAMLMWWQDVSRMQERAYGG